MGEAPGSVQKRTLADIERLAQSVRSTVGVGPSGRISMMPLLEFALDSLINDAYMQVVSDQEMDGAEGRTDWHQPVITLAASSYSALLRSDARARMTAAHELGHLLMHTQQPVYHYRSRSKDRRGNPEWQDDAFASALLMPREAFKKMKTVSQAKKTFGVSRGAALVRARILNMPLIDDTARRPGGKKKGHGSNRTP